MSVHEERRADGTVVFKVRWRQGGKNRAKAFNSAKLGGRRAAERAARDFDGQMARAQALGEAHDPAKGRLALGEYVDELLERSWWENLTEETQDVYALQLDKRILPFFGDWPVRDISPAAVERFVTWMRRQRDGRGRQTGDPTILKALTVLQAILKRAVIDGHVQTNAVAHVDKPKQRRTRDPRPVEPIYVERMRRHLLERGEPGDALLVCLLAYAGPRPESEAIKLAADGVRKRTLKLVATKQNDEPRAVPIEAPLGADLIPWKLALVPSTHGLLLPFADGHVRPEGDEWSGSDWDNWRDRVFRPAAEAAGITWDIRPRDLRGSYATLLVHADIKITEVARRLGDSPQTLLKHYASVFEEFDPADAVSAAEQIERARRAALFPPGSREEAAALAATG